MNTSTMPHTKSFTLSNSDKEVRPVSVKTNIATDTTTTIIRINNPIHVDIALATPDFVADNPFCNDFKSYLAVFITCLCFSTNCCVLASSSAYTYMATHATLHLE